MYRDWAATYDTDFAAAMDYFYPKSIAEIYSEFATNEDGPVLDVGAGTGLVAEALKPLGNWQIDALDISQEMLDVALGKACYRRAVCANLTKKLPLDDAGYGGLISAGTFTHGHVGPDAIDELMRIARPGALFVLGINSEVYEAEGFRAKFQSMDSAIAGFQILERAVYGENAKVEYRTAVSTVAVFRKA